MDSYELIIGSERVELTENVISNLALNFSVSDITEPEQRKADFSKNFDIPFSKKINKLFASIFEINTDLTGASFNPNRKEDAYFLVNSVQQFEGFIQLKKVNKTAKTYTVNLFGRLANLFADIGDDEMTALDLSEYDHDWTQVNQIDSWDTQIQVNGSPQAFALGTGYVYPLIDFGFDNDEDRFSVTHLFPAVYSKTYIDKIFEAAGYSYNSTFLDSTYLKSHIHPYNEITLRLSESQVEDRRAIANSATPVNNTVTSFNLGTPNVIPAADITTTVQDNLSQIDLVANTITIAQDGFYEVTFEGNYNAVFTHPAPGTAITTNGHLNVIQRIRRNDGSNTTSIATRQLYIQADGSFTADYTTAINPTPTTAEYLTQINPDVENIQNPASAVIANRNNIRLNAGDILTVELSYWFQEVLPVGEPALGAKAFQQVADPTVYYTGVGNIELNINAVDFRIKSDNNALLEGNEIDMNSVIPTGIKQRDYLTAFIRRHNLYLEPDRDNPRVLNIEPRDDYYTSDVEDWSLKLDYSSELCFEPLSANKYGVYIFTDEEDSDYYNSQYQENYGETYGRRRIVIDNDFLTDTKEVKTIFAPTPSIGSDTHDRVIPEIFKTDSQNNKTQFQSKMRVLYYGGLKSTNRAWYFDSDIVTTTVQTEYPYSGHFDDPYNPTVDLNWGLPREIYWDDTWQDITVTNQGLYNRYYYKAINEITNVNSKTVTGLFNLTPTDINRLDFRKFYHFDNAYFRLQKVVDYNPIGCNLTKCVFLLAEDVGDFTAATGNANGGTGDVFDEKLPITSKNEKNLNGQGNPLNQIIGENNFIDPLAKNVLIQGDNNQVLGDVKNVTIIGSGYTVEESNTVIIDANVSFPNTNPNPSASVVKFISASQSVESDVEMYVVDSTSGDVTLTFDGSGYVAGQTWTIVKDVKNNIIILDADTNLINGKSTKSIKQQYTAIEVTYDGLNFRIT